MPAPPPPAARVLPSGLNATDAAAAPGRVSRSLGWVSATPGQRITSPSAAEVHQIVGRSTRRGIISPPENEDERGTKATVYFLSGRTGLRSCIDLAVSMRLLPVTGDPPF